jgi:hypothetical protein
MKKLLSLLFAGVLVLSLAGSVLAQPDDHGKGQASQENANKKKKKKHHKKKNFLGLKTAGAAVGGRS